MMTVSARETTYVNRQFNLLTITRTDIKDPETAGKSPGIFYSQNEEVA